MQRKPITFGVARKARRARRKLVHLTDLDAAGFEPFSHGLHVVHLEGSAGGRSRLESQRLAVSYSEGGVANVELYPMVAERITLLEPERLGLKSARAWHVTYGVGEESDILNHGRPSRPGRLHAEAAEP